jgi:hypothetical protein
MTERTPGAPNAEPLVGPVVINEVMYHPPDLTGGIDNLDHEFVELHNIMDVSVSLYTYFAAVDETHPWKFTGGIDFSFSVDETMAPYGYLLVVSFDPLTEPAKLADFLATYGLGGSEPVVGPYLGKLSNTGETLRLRKPDTPELVPEYFVPYIVVDEVPYADYPPWPPEPDGQGPSLERIIPTAVGDVQTNWRASSTAGGTPGAVNTCPAAGDHDGDGEVDLDDFEYFEGCLAGPDGGLSTPRCTCFDLDDDGDVDLFNLAAFQAAFTG